MTTEPLTIDDVRQAAERIGPHVHRTPVFTSATVDRELGAEVFFKCENLQKVGAFKARGALNAVLSLSDDVAPRGVITHSSGNHAAALAWAAGIRGIPCTVVMPEDAPAIKVDAVRGYHAEIVFCRRADRHEACDRERSARQQTLVHPYEHPQVVAGQGTVALELLDQVDGLDLVIAPVGGGGLLAGTALTVSSLASGTPVWGAEPEAVDDAYRSLVSGERQPGVPDPITIADGLMTGLGQLNFDMLHRRGVQVVTVSEAEIVVAARTLLERLKLVVEPSGATVLAALRRSCSRLPGRRIGAVLSGGNTDFGWIRQN